MALIEDEEYTETDLSELIDIAEEGTILNEQFTTEDTDNMVLLGRLNAVIAELQSIHDLVSSSDTNASEALSSAITALSNANTALSTANTAISTANTAITTANNALETSNSAEDKADAAVITADNAEDKADAAVADAAAALAGVESKAEQADLTTEISNRTAADTTLQSNINSEASTRATNDATLQTNINTEASARVSADTDLNTYKIGGNTVYGGSIVGNLNTLAKTCFFTCYYNATGMPDTSAYGTNLSAFGVHINSNAGSTYATQRIVLYNSANVITLERVKAEGTWGNWIDTTFSNKANDNEVVKVITQSLTEAQKQIARNNIGAGDSGFSGSYNDLSDIPTDFVYDADLASEANTRASADSTLQTNINTVSSNLSTETTNRVSADTTLQGNITTEATARAAADALLCPLARTIAGHSLKNDITKTTLLNTFGYTDYQVSTLYADMYITDDSSAGTSYGTLTMTFYSHHIRDKDGISKSVGVIYATRSGSGNRWNDCETVSLRNLRDSVGNLLYWYNGGMLFHSESRNDANETGMFVYHPAYSANGGTSGSIGGRDAVYRSYIPGSDWALNETSYITINNVMIGSS